MEKRLILHIGMHKTASTSIQHVLKTNAAAFQQNGILFIPVFQQIAQLFVDRSPLSQPEIQAIQEDISPLLTSNGFHTILGSAENFFGRMNQFTGLAKSDLVIEDLRRLLEPFPLKIKFVAFLRRQDTWLESVYQQVVKWAEVRSFDEFYKEKNPDDFRWERIISRYEETFGKGCVRCIPFETLNWPDNNGLDAFSHAMGFNGTNPFKPLPRKNPGLNQKGLEVLRCTNHLLDFNERQQLRFFVEKILPRKPKEKIYYMDTADRRQLLTCLEDSNRTLFETYMPEIPFLYGVDSIKA